MESKSQRKWLVVGMIGILLLLCGAHLHGKEFHGEWHGEEWDGWEHARARQEVETPMRLSALGNGEYASSCGGCHLPFRPDLLPASIWKRTLLDMDDHFGFTISMDPDRVARIGTYLERGSADVGGTRLGREVMRELAEDGMAVEDVRSLAALPLVEEEHGDEMVRDCGDCHP